MRISLESNFPLLERDALLHVVLSSNLDLNILLFNDSLAFSDIFPLQCVVSLFLLLTLSTFKLHFIEALPIDV